MSYLEKIKEMYAMIGQGQLLEAFEKYYHEDIVMIEGHGDVCKGKADNREREQDFVESIETMHGSGVTAFTANEETGVTMVEAWMELTFKGAPMSVRMEEVAVQKWEGDQIIHERFYYDPSFMGEEE